MATTHSVEMLVGVSPVTRRRRLYWTLGNLMLIGGLYLLLYVGGLYAEAEFHRMAARGDSDIEPPRVMMGARAANADLTMLPSQIVAAPPEGLPVFQAPVLNGGQIASEVPDAAALAHVSKVERIVLPSIKVDSKVIEVGWDIVEQDGQQVAVWQVAEYAVGQHRGTANPGEGGNVVLAGHVGGYGKVFRDLYYVRPGEPVIIYSDGQQFLYTVSERIIVTEEGVPPEQRAENAKLIGPTDSEVVTLITCWPLTGPDKFSQRVIIRAVPFEAAAPPVADIAPQTVR
jgi:LPXTG-site transpeptidase (sortase) family protein